MHLLPQVVFPLAFVQRGVDLIIKVALDFQHLALLTQQHQQFFQAAQQRGLIQDGLLILVFQQEVCGHVLTQEQWAVRADDVIDDVLGDLRAVGEVLLKAVFQTANEGLGLGAFIGTDAAHRHRAHAGLQEVAIVQFQQAGAGLALHQHLDEVVGNAQHLLDLGDDTVGVEVRHRGFFHVHLFLGDKENAAVSVHSSLDGGDGFSAAHLKVDDIIGENHQPAQGDSRQYTDIAGDFDFHFLRHCLLSHDLQNRCVVCEFWRQKDTGAAPCRLGVQRFLGRTFAVQGGDHRLWVQHPDVDGRCAEVR